MFAGRRAFPAETLTDMIRLQGESHPTEISNVVRDIDPATERIILKCLDPDPLNRPASALVVAAALPGGDPLAAALAAGETPSPEMVAAAGTQEGLRQRSAMALLAAVLVLLAVVPFANNALLLAGRMNLELPPEALAVQARKILQQSGYDAPPADRAFGFEYNDYDEDLEAWLSKRSQTPKFWTPSVLGSFQPVVFWYRQSPQTLVADSMERPGQVTDNNPPALLSGMARVSADADGRLIELLVVPPQRDDSSALPPRVPDPAPLFSAAGLDFKSFQSAAPSWTGTVDNDQRAAWTGPFPDHPEWTLRVEAAWWRGRPVYFQVIPPWSRPFRLLPDLPAHAGLNDFAVLLQSMVFLAGAGWLAWQNWRGGRGDRQGAVRLAAFTFLAAFLGGLLVSHALLSTKMFQIVGAVAAKALWSGFTMWLAYLALEPPVRRRWPQILISWTRVLTGKWRDPLVARHALIGIFVGLTWCLIFSALLLFARTMGSPPEPGASLGSLLGLPSTIGYLLGNVTDSLRTALVLFVTLFLLRWLVRKEWLAAACFVAVNVAARSLPNDHPLVLVPVFTLIFSLIVVVLMRFGLLSVVLAIFTVNALNSFVVTTNFSAWYGTGSLVVLCLFGATCVLCYRRALGNPRPAAVSQPA
jgi:serine/threonine-protein kinase